jgi:glycolate oxidase
MVWKGELGAQQMMLSRMDPDTVSLIRKVKGLLDPNGIMNPGNWELK